LTLPSSEILSIQLEILARGEPKIVATKDRARLGSHDDDSLVVDFSPRPTYLVFF
jgi:hypothetical protein